MYRSFDVSRSLRAGAVALAVGAAVFVLSFSVSALGASQPKATKGQILVVLSSAAKITVDQSADGSELAAHPTGFFLSELMVPLSEALDAGYLPVFASPKGTVPVLDKVSDSAAWFGGDEAAYLKYRGRCEKLGICGKPGEIQGTKKTVALGTIVPKLGDFAGVLFPGGHAPMEDLYRSESVAAVLKHFHDNRKPTALICHAPVALLSTLEDPSSFAQVLTTLNRIRRATGPSPSIGKDADLLEARLLGMAKGWPYAGYQVAVFSTKEEKQEEPGQDNVLGGYVRFYPDEALDFAGARTLVRGRKWQPNAIRYRELITGQNPFSDHEFAKLFVDALKEQSADTVQAVPIAE